jgi:hypothetical protein
MTTPRSSRSHDADRSDATGSPTRGATGADRGVEADPPAEKPVEEWVTGDEPMTGPQRSYLQTLAREAGEDLPEEELTKAAASELIERLQRATGRIPADRQR